MASLKSQDDKRLTKSRTDKTKSITVPGEYTKSAAATRKTVADSKKSLQNIPSKPNLKMPTTQGKIVKQQEIDIPEDAQNEITEIKSPSSFSLESNKESLQDNDSNLQQDNFLKFDIDSDEMSLHEEEWDDVEQNQVENVLDFFDMLGEIPDVAAVSLDDLIVQEPIASETMPELKTVEDKLDDSVTEVSALDSVESKTLESEDMTSFKEGEHNLSQIEEEPLSSSEDSIAESMDDFANVKVLPTGENETFQYFLQATKPEQLVITDEIHLAKAALTREEQKHEEQKTILDFLNKIIDHCVAESLYSEKNAVLRNSLDKQKLINELKSKYDSLQMERRVSEFVNQKVVNFFKRKGSFRSISEDPAKSLALYREKYDSALKNLDYWMNKEETAKTVNIKQISDLKNELEDVQQKHNTELKRLEQLMNRSARRKSFGKLHTSINKYTNKMSAIRKEISQVRMQLILKHHQICTLKKQVEKSEDLGNGLNIHHFELLETETMALQKKIEEHNCAYKKLHNSFNGDIHKVTHIREKQKMLRSIILAKNQCLSELNYQKKDLREYVNQLKLQHSRLRYEIGILGHQSGIFTKPALIRDYDETAEKANKLRETNEGLRRTIKELYDKIAALEQNCVT